MTTWVTVFSASPPQTTKNAAKKQTAKKKQTSPVAPPLPDIVALKKQIEKIKTKVQKKVKKRKPGRPSKIEVAERIKEKQETEQLEKELIKAIQHSDKPVSVAGIDVPDYPIWSLNDRVTVIDKCFVGEDRRYGIVVRHDLGNRYARVAWDDGCVDSRDATVLMSANKKRRKVRSAT